MEQKDQLQLTHCLNGKTNSYSFKKNLPIWKAKKKNIGFFYKENSWLNEWYFFRNSIKNKTFKNIDEGLVTMKNLDRIKKLKK